MQFYSHMSKLTAIKVLGSYIFHGAIMKMEMA